MSLHIRSHTHVSCTDIYKIKSSFLICLPDCVPDVCVLEQHPVAPAADSSCEPARCGAAAGAAAAATSPSFKKRFRGHRACHACIM